MTGEIDRRPRPRKHGPPPDALVKRKPYISAVRLLFLLFLGALAALSARAAEPGASDWFETEQGRVRLVAAAEGELGLQFELAPGWKIYWRSPGDAGYP